MENQDKLNFLQRKAEEIFLQKKGFSFRLAAEAPGLTEEGYLEMDRFFGLCWLDANDFLKENKIDL